jgi:hypothetical protein
MKGEFKKDSAEFKLFGDFYALVKDYYIAEPTDEWWNGWLKRLDEFWDKYGVDKSRKYKQRNKVALLAYIMGLAVADFIDNCSANGF